MEYFAKLYIINIFKIIIFSIFIFLIYRKINLNPERYKIFAERNSKFILLFLVILYTIVFSLLSILKHNNFNTNCYDLASYLQPIYQTIKGNLLYCSPEGKNYLGVHSTFSLLLFVPFYYIFPDAHFILFLQSLILALGAVPIYLIAKEKLTKSHSLLFAFLYLICPPLHYINLYDFHSDILVVPSFLFAFYFLSKKDYLKMCIFLTIAFLTKEQMSLTILIFGLYIFFIHKKRILGASISIISLIWFFATVFYIIPYFSPSKTFQHFAGYGWLGDTFFDKIKTFFFNPLFVLENVLTPVKIGYVILLFLPVAYLSFLSSIILFAFPTFFINLLSNTIQHNSIFFQYTASIIPFLFISAIYGFSKIKIKKFSLLILFLSLFFSYYFGPSPLSKSFWCKNYQLGEFKTLNFNISCYLPTSHTSVLLKAIKIIPENSSASVQTQIAPHLINREELYLFPDIPKNTEYIIIDKKGNIWPLIDRNEYEIIVKKLLQDKRYTIIFEKDEVIVLRRNIK